MAITNRKDARADLVATITATGVWQVVYDHRPKDPQGQSPLCTVLSMGQFPQFLPADVNLFRFMLTNWVKRDDAGAAETQLDDLAYQLALVIHGWKNAEFFTESAVDIDEIEEVQYLVEDHFVEVDWQG